MARPTLISNEQQIVEWIAEGRPYREIVDLYEMAFGRRLSQSTINNVRKRNDMPGRNHRDDRLIPWAVAPEHRDRMDLVMLRTEGRLRAGLPVIKERYDQLRTWRRDLEDVDMVIHYEPDDGFTWVPRRPGVDRDLIREPEERSGRPGYG